MYSEGLKCSELEHFQGKVRRADTNAQHPPSQEQDSKGWLNAVWVYYSQKDKWRYFG